MISIVAALWRQSPTLHIQANIDFWPLVANLRLTPRGHLTIQGWNYEVRHFLKQRQGGAPTDIFSGNPLRRVCFSELFGFTCTTSRLLATKVYMQDLSNQQAAEKVGRNEEEKASRGECRRRFLA